MAHGKTWSLQFVDTSPMEEVVDGTRQRFAFDWLDFDMAPAEQRALYRRGMQAGVAFLEK